MSVVRHILILGYLAELSQSQSPVDQPLTNLQNLLLNGVVNQHRLFEPIVPLDGLHILRQAVSASPVLEQQPLIGDLLRSVTRSPPLFNPHHRLLTVTVPNPLYSLNLSQFSETSAPQVVIMPNVKTTDSTEELPKMLTAIGVTTEKAGASKVSNPHGVAEIHSITSTSPYSLNITKLNLAIKKNPKQSIKGGQSEELYTVTDLPEATLSIETSAPLFENYSLKKSAAEEVQTIAPSLIEQPSEHTQNAIPTSFHLIDHLNHSNIESFLKKTNISTAEAQNFSKLVEGVFEEVKKRLQTQNHRLIVLKNYPPVEHLSAKKGELKLQSSDIQPSLDASAAEKVNDEHEYNSNEAAELTSHRRHELKTVDTKLSYEGKAIVEDVSAESRETHLPILSLRIADRNARVHSSPNLSSERALQNRHLSPKLAEDYRIREQEDFDKTIKKEDLSVFEEQTTVPSQKSTSSVSTIISIPAPFNYSTRVPNHYRSGYHTQFEMLAKDYQYRLSGINGLTDVFKALQNAKIGFYESPTYQRYNKKDH